MKDNLSDDDLMRKFSDCSLEAFKTLYYRKKDVLYNHIIFSNRLNPDIAQDIAQNTLIKVYESKFVYNHRNKFNSWLFKIVRNLAINEINRIARTSATDNINLYEDRQSYTIDSDNSADFEHKINIVKSEILKLKDIYREVIWLKYIGNMTLEEISEATNNNINTVKSRLKRGLELLTKNLKNLNFENL